MGPVSTTVPLLLPIHSRLCGSPGVAGTVTVCDGVRVCHTAVRGSFLVLTVTNYSETAAWLLLDCCCFYRRSSNLTVPDDDSRVEWWTSRIFRRYSSLSGTTLLPCCCQRYRCWRFRNLPIDRTWFRFLILFIINRN